MIDETTFEREAYESLRAFTNSIAMQEVAGGRQWACLYQGGTCLYGEADYRLLGQHFCMCIWHEVGTSASARVVYSWERIRNQA